MTKENLQPQIYEFSPPDVLKGIIPGFSFEAESIRGELSEDRKIVEELARVASNPEIQWFLNPPEDMDRVTAAVSVVFYYNGGEQVIQVVAQTRKNMTMEIRRSFEHADEPMNEYDFEYPSYRDDLFSVAVNYGTGRNSDGEYRVTSTYMYGTSRQRFFHNSSSIHPETARKLLEAMKANSIPLVLPRENYHDFAYNQSLKLEVEPNNPIDKFRFKLTHRAIGVRDKTSEANLGLSIREIFIPPVDVIGLPSWDNSQFKCQLPGYVCNPPIGTFWHKEAEEQIRENVYRYEQAWADIMIGYPVNIPDYLKPVE